MGQWVFVGLFHKARQREIVVFHFLSKQKSNVESSQYLGPLIHAQYYQDNKELSCFSKHNEMNNNKKYSITFLNFH